jgi:hypothetical protein
MTEAKKKARELVDKYVYHVESYSSEGQLENAKTCSLILVDEIIENIVNINVNYGGSWTYWQEVRSEIKAI